VFLPREWAIVRTCVAFGVAGAFLRLIEIVRKPETFDLRQRVINVLAPFLDARRFQTGPTGICWSAFLTAAAELAVAIVLVILAGQTPPTHPYASLAALERTTIGGASCYLFVDATGRAVHALCLSCGLVVDKPHDMPILSRSLGEFWGKRWNRVVNKWLHDNTFRPVAVRAGISAGIFAAFALSGVLHFVPIALVCSVQAATWMLTFFLIHGVLVIAEAKLRIESRAVTIGAFLITSPLFVEPMLESLGF
jgi:hypothetical protein